MMPATIAVRMSCAETIPYTCRIVVASHAGMWRGRQIKLQAECLAWQVAYGFRVHLTWLERVPEAKSLCQCSTVRGVRPSKCLSASLGEHINIREMVSGKARNGLYLTDEAPAQHIVCL